LEKCYVEMVLEVASDVDYDCDVYKGDDEIVTYTRKISKWFGKKEDISWSSYNDNVPIQSTMKSTYTNRHQDEFQPNDMPRFVLSS
jgi:hypothetical protein